MPGTRSKKRQTTLGFSPLPSSSPAKASQPAATRDRAAAVIISDSSRPAKRRKLHNVSTLPTPEKSSAAHLPKSSNLESLSHGSPKSSFMKHSAQPSSKRGKSRPVVELSSASSEGSDDNSKDSDDELASTPVPKNGTAEDAALEAPDDSESDASPLPSRLSTVNYSAKKRGRKARSPSFVVEGDSDDLDSTPVPKRRKIRRTRHLIDDVDDDDDDSEPLPLPKSSLTKRKRTLRPPSVKNDSDDESEDDDISASSKRLRLRRGRSAEADSEEERDLEEDLDFLRSTSPGPVPTRRSPAKSAKQRALAELKNRRAKQAGGQPIDLVSDGDDSAEQDDEAIFDNGEDRLSLDDGEDAEDFIVEDESDGGGELVSQIPIEFRLRTMKPKELFRFVVEFFVQKKINPGFDREDEVYRIALDRTNDFVQGMAGSKFSSSAWTPRFLRALRARPQLEESNFVSDAVMRDRCDACNRSGHPATWEVRFHGKAYDKKTFEEFSDDEEEDDGVSDTRLPSESTVFYIGKFCMQKSRVSHALHHWRFHLNEWIVDYLERKGHLKPKKIVKRDSWSARKRNKKANKIVRLMEEEGEIKALYRDFKNETSTAHKEGEDHFHYSSD